MKKILAIAMLALVTLGALSACGQSSPVADPIAQDNKGHGNSK